MQIRLAWLAIVLPGGLRLISQQKEAALQASTHSPDDSTALTRREFTADAVLALLMGCVITVSQACGDDNPTGSYAQPD